jgi:hypothetical protein
VILGAGFSKAVSTAMPVLWELGGLVVERLGLSPATLRPFGGDLERWLSHLAVDQPWLSSADNLANRSLFLRASEAVGQCIDEAELQVVANPPDDWLLRLVLDWARREAAIITFNYDLLIERVMLGSLRLIGSLSDLYGMALTERRPPGAGLRYGASPPAWRAPTLFKLHGSTNWGYGGIDSPPNELVTLLDKDVTWPSTEASDSDVERRRKYLFSGLEPLIVPPAGSKTDFYRNRALRAQWMNVAGLLQHTRRLTIIGFSFPPTDLQVRQLVATSIRRPLIEVVDPQPKVVQTVREMTDPAISIESYIESDPLSAYVEATCADVVRWNLRRTGDVEAGHRGQVSVNQQVVFDERLEADYEIAQSRLTTFVENRWPGIGAQSYSDRSLTGAPNLQWAFLGMDPAGRFRADDAR